MFPDLAKTRWGKGELKKKNPIILKALQRTVDGKKKRCKETKFQREIRYASV